MISFIWTFISLLSPLFTLTSASRNLKAKWKALSCLEEQINSNYPEHLSSRKAFCLFASSSELWSLLQKNTKMEDSCGYVIKMMVKICKKKCTPAVMEPKSSNWLYQSIGDFHQWLTYSTQGKSDKRHFGNIFFKIVLFTLFCLQALPFGPHSSNACFVDIMVCFGDK